MDIIITEQIVNSKDHNHCWIIAEYNQKSVESGTNWLVLCSKNTYEYKALWSKCNIDFVRCLVVKWNCSENNIGTENKTVMILKSSCHYRTLLGRKRINQVVLDLITSQDSKSCHFIN